MLEAVGSTLAFFLGLFGGFKFETYFYQSVGSFGHSRDLFSASRISCYQFHRLIALHLQVSLFQGGGSKCGSQHSHCEQKNFALEPRGGWVERGYLEMDALLGLPYRKTCQMPAHRKQLLPGLPAHGYTRG